MGDHKVANTMSKKPSLPIIEEHHHHEGSSEGSFVSADSNEEAPPAKVMKPMLAMV
jgi:hypothetical protein